MNKKYIDDNNCKLHRTFTPLIDWDYENPTTFYNGTKANWKGYLNHVSYTFIYADGRYAAGVYPLKQPFTDFDEIMVVYQDMSGGTPDVSTSIFKTDVFDFLLHFPLNESALSTFYSIQTPNYEISTYRQLYVSYNGSKSTGFTYDYQKSSPKRLIGLPSYYQRVLEIYGIK